MGTAAVSLNRQISNLNGHSVIARVSIPTGTKYWDRAISYIETLLKHWVHEITAPSSDIHGFYHRQSNRPSWSALSILSDSLITADDTKIVYKNGPLVVTYEYVVVKGEVPSRITLQEAIDNAVNRTANLKILAPGGPAGC